MEPHFLSLADIGQLPTLPIECKLALVGVGLVFFGYVCGLIDREPRVKIEIDLKPRETITPLAEAEKQSATAQKTAMGIGLPTPEEIKERQERLRELIGNQAQKPATRGAGRNSKGQFVRGK